MRKKLREEMQIEFTIENGKLHILDGIRVTRRPRAAVTIAVSLAKDEIITKEEWPIFTIHAPLLEHILKMSAHLRNTLQLLWAWEVIPHLTQGLAGYPIYILNVGRLVCQLVRHIQRAS